MWLTNVSIRRPVFITMFVLALIVMGWISRSKMPAELYPKVEFPFVSIITVYPGAGPQEVETLISEPIEEAVGSISNLRNVTSTSQDGVSVVGLEFELGTNLEAAAADVRDKVSAARGQLPDDIEEPIVSKVDVSAVPVMTIGMSGPLSSKDMRILADNTVKDRLSRVGGVAAVYVSGGDIREIRVSIDKGRIDAYGISVNQVAMAIRQSNLNLPSGSIKEGSRDFAVRAVGEFSSADQIANTRISIMKGTKPLVVRIGDIANVKDTIKDPDILSRLNGKPTVVLAVQKQSDANTVDVANGVKEELHKLGKVLPSGVQTIIATDQSVFVEDALHDVNKSLLEGVILVVLIVFLFLHSARATFIVAIAIPTSILATFLPISSFDFSLNMMTMLALSLCVGILVDDSIVVLENIERHLRMGESPQEAALNGRSEIGLAAITITLVDVVVFVPIAFMGGIVGQFFRQFGVTVAVATLFSLFMSFTLTPMLASRWMKSRSEHENGIVEADPDRLVNASFPVRAKARADAFVSRLFGKFEQGYMSLDHLYRAVLEWALGNRYMVIVIGTMSLLSVLAMIMPQPPLDNPKAIAGWIPRLFIAFLTLALCAIAMRRRSSRGVAFTFAVVAIIITLGLKFPFGGEMMPEVDEGEFSVIVEAPAGSSLKYTDSVVRQVENLLAKYPEMQYYQTTVGTSSAGDIVGSGDRGAQYSRVSVKLVDKNERERGVRDVADDLQQKTALISGADIKVQVVQGVGHGSPIGMEVQGTNTQEMVRVADSLIEKIKRVPGTMDVDTSWKVGKPELRISVDRDRAADRGISISDIALAARTSIEGDTSSKFREGGDQYDIRVQLANFDRRNATDVSNLVVGIKEGSPIYMRDVADVEMANAPTKIDRKNRQRLITVSSNLQRGYVLGNVQSQIEREMKTIPTGAVTIATGGTGEIMQESFAYMISALFLSILLVYMLMGALFESFFSPFIIMFSLPQAMVGGLLFLLVTGKSMSIVAMIGIIMLMGLVTKNAILLVDYTNTLRQKGKPRDEAILEAGPTRLRPIIMTTLAMVLGMLPTALAAARGAEMRQPMAIVVIGGLLFSSMLTLVVIPVVYTIVDDIINGLMRRFAPGRSRPSRLRSDYDGTHHGGSLTVEPKEEVVD